MRPYSLLFSLDSLQKRLAVNGKAALRAAFATAPEAKEEAAAVKAA
jgi:hypothetical protein